MLPSGGVERGSLRIQSRSSTSNRSPAVSHIVTIRTQVRDPIAVASACERLALPAPIVGTAKLFSSQASGLIVQLPRWRYQRDLDSFIQAYSVEKTKLEARKAGHTVSEQALTDGSIKVRIVAA
jgi:hypothetical protein